MCIITNTYFSLRCLKCILGINDSAFSYCNIYAIFRIFAEIKTQPTLNVNINVNTSDLGNNLYVVDLNLVLNGDTDGKKLFILELTYSAAVTLNVPSEHIEGVLNVEIPRLIYPYARNVITQCLLEGGLPPIMLNPLDFGVIYEARKKRAQENAAEKSDTDSEKKN